MNYDASLINYFLHASIVVKIVMSLLGIASVFSWAYIFQRAWYLSAMNRAATRFEEAFWSGEELKQLYLDSNKKRGSLKGLEAIFNAGFKEFHRFKKQMNVPLETIMDNTKRAMRIAQVREQDKMERQLSYLAIVGSTSPYVGLFGTVWGIMQSFRALANVQQATISMVAPGIAEALIATALGLFAAIPAVIAYNYFVTTINRLINRMNTFEEELTNILIRQSQSVAMPAQSLQLETME